MVMTCPYPGCSWRPVTPSSGAALDRTAEHIVVEHAREVDCDVPEDGALVSHDGGETWEVRDY